MAFRGLRVLAVVPARGGSKGVPRKNLRLVRGVSLVGRAARTLAELDFVDRSVCSTDDPEIAAEAERHGLLVPALRPAELATDTASSVDVWRHAWIEQAHRDGVIYDVSLLVQPTSPLRRPADLRATLASLVERGAKAAATVSRTPGDYTPHKTLTVGPDGRIGFYLPDGARYARRQDIPPYYHRNGVCYAARRETVIERGTIIEDDCVAVIIDRPLVNIDDANDLIIAEYLASDEPW